MIKQKILRGTPYYFSKLGRLNNFVYLMVNLPFVCNYRCKKCFNLVNNINLTKSRVNDKKLLALIEEAKKIGGKAVVLAGEGEPALNKAFKKFIRKINTLEMIPIIYSNGSLLNEKIIQFLAKNNVSLIISLDSLSPDLYKELTGIKNANIFYKVLDNIGQARKNYKKLTEERNGHKILRLAINFTLNSLNKKEAEKIKKFCDDDIFFICNPLAKLGNANGNWRELIKDSRDFYEIKNLAKKLSESGGPLMLGENRICNYSKNGIAISPSGEYMTCAYTSLTSGLLGSVNNESLLEAYNYKRTREQKFYKEHGSCQCLVRSPNFSSYLKSLK